LDKLGKIVVTETQRQALAPLADRDVFDVAVLDVTANGVFADTEKVCGLP